MVYLKYTKNEKGSFMMSAFDRIIGYASVKRELQQISDTLKNQEAYNKLGVSMPKGLLLYGEPGVGKSLMAEALIEESGHKCFLCRKDASGDDFIKKIRNTFEQAVQNAPSIVYLDDLDKFSNSDEIHPNAEEYVVVQSCIDSVKDQSVFILATANELRNLPRSLRRAGRFDRQMGIDVPHGPDACKIVAHYLKSLKLVNRIDPNIAGELMDGYSCAELETVINEAGLYAGYDRAETITMEYFVKAYLRTTLEISIDSWDREAVSLEELHEKNPEFAHIIYHEAGHIVLSEVLQPGRAVLAYVHDHEGEKSGMLKAHRTHSDQIQTQVSNIIISLGGRAAVEQKYGEVDTGSNEDLEDAFGSARFLLSGLCLNGFYTHALIREPSQSSLSVQEQAVLAEVERCYRKAKELLTLNSDFLEKTAEALANKGFLLATDILEIRKNCHIIPANLKALI